MSTNQLTSEEIKSLKYATTLELIEILIHIQRPTVIQEPMNIFMQEIQRRLQFAEDNGVTSE